MLHPLVALLLSIAARPCAQDATGLSEWERAGGWICISAESARAQWALPAEGWILEAGVLRRAAGASAPASWEPLETDFELDFEWREDPQAGQAWSSGRVVLRRDGSALALLGEQRFDRDPQAGMPSFRAGPIELRPAQRAEGWHVALLPGASAFEYRSMKLRRTAGASRPLFDGATLAGWRALGDARFSVVDGELRGEVGGGSQSFLRSEASFGDFVLELELLNEAPGNSGVQVRSQETAAQRLMGYQIEVDPSDRAWSGGLYDEARRGWLDDLSDNPHGRAAFRPGAWNRYRIECNGPWIRAWVNDVPTADFLDALDLEGVIGLQVHSGKNTKMRWREIRIRELGTSRWVETQLERAGERRHGASLPLGGGGLRIPLEPAVAGAQPASDGASLAVITPEGEWRMPVTLAAGAAHEVVVVCYPPRLAAWIDGERLPAATFLPRPVPGSSTIRVELECAQTLEPTAVRRLVRN